MPVFGDNRGMISTTLSIGGSHTGGGTKPLTGGLSSLIQTISKSTNVAFSYGTGVGQINTIFESERVLLAGTNETLVLTDSSLTDIVGDVFNLATCRAAIFEITSSIATGSAGILVGNAASHPFGFWMGAAANTFLLEYPGTAVWSMAGATGKTVTSGSNDQIKITNTDATNAVTYRITLAGLKV